MAIVEAPMHDNVKQALVDADELSTTYMRSMRNTERVFNNKIAQEVLKLKKKILGNLIKFII